MRLFFGGFTISRKVGDDHGNQMRRRSEKHQGLYGAPVGAAVNGPNRTAHFRLFRLPFVLCRGNPMGA